MNELIDRLLDLILNSSIESLPNKKIARWFRLIVILIPTVIRIAIIIAGIVTIKDTLLGGITIIIIGIVLLVFFLIKINKTLKKSTKNK